MNWYFYICFGKFVVQFELKVFCYILYVYLDGIVVVVIEIVQDGIVLIKYVYNDIFGSFIVYSFVQGIVFQCFQYIIFGMLIGVSDGKFGFIGYVEDVDLGMVYM